ncbi:hypothetical protein Hanom_Chr13g01233681 [Helianthus anomalus]
MINKLLSNFRISIRRDNISQKKLVNKLQMRPRRFKISLVFIRLHAHRPRILMGRRRQTSKNINRNHPNHLLLIHLTNFPRSRLHIINKLHKIQPLNLLLLNRLQRIRKIKQHATNLTLPNKQLLPFRYRNITKHRERLHTPYTSRSRHSTTTATIRHLLRHASTSRGMVHNNIRTRNRTGYTGNFRVGFRRLPLPSLHKLIQHTI